MPSRIIREGILSSERVDQLTDWAAECFYRRLMSVVDDFGRYYGNNSLIRAACYPLKVDTVSNADIERWLEDCASSSLIFLYESNGKRYLQMLDFRQQTRAKESKFPKSEVKILSECVADAKHMKTSVHLDVVVVEDVVGVGDGASAPVDKSDSLKKSKLNDKRAKLPKGWYASEAGITQAGKILGIDAHRGESLPNYKARIEAAIV